MPSKTPTNHAAGRKDQADQARLRELSAERRALARERAQVDSQVREAQASVDRLREILAQRRRDEEQVAARQRRSGGEDSGNGGSSG